jgi:hypothetical protein
MSQNILRARMLGDARFALIQWARSTDGRSEPDVQGRGGLGETRPTGERSRTGGSEPDGQWDLGSNIQESPALNTVA